MSTDRALDPGAAGRNGLRVAFVTSIFPNPEEPTLGTFHEQIVRQLAERCAVTVISPQPWFPRLPVLTAALEPWLHYARIPRTWRVHGLTVQSPKYVMVPRISESVRALLMLPGILRAIVRLHRARRFDVVAGLWLYPDGVAAAWASRWLGVPLVLVGLGCDINVCMDVPAQARQILSAVRRASSVIVVSQNLKDRLCAAGVPAAHVSVVANGVDLERFRPRDRAAAARDLGLTDSGPRCLYVGRLAEEKGVTYLVEAMRALQARRSGVTLYVVGDGPLRRPCEALVEQSGLGKVVRFVGARDHAEVGSWIAAADLLCLPSLREGCPNVVLEALASGRPVVATRVGDVPDVVHAGNGVLVDPADGAQLAAALDTALAIDWDPEAIRQSMSRRSWTAVAERYYGAFRTAAVGGVPRGLPIARRNVSI